MKKKLFPCKYASRMIGLFVIIACVICAYLAWVYLMTPYTDNSGYNDVQYCTSAIDDDYVLQESELYCPFCGNLTIAVNKEIVCRNESCDKYGLPVMVYDEIFEKDCRLE